MNGSETTPKLIKPTQTEAGTTDGSIPIPRQLTYAALLTMLVVPVAAMAFWDNSPTLSPEVVSIKVEQARLQTMPLLSASMSTVFPDARGGSEIITVDGALVPNGNPTGNSEIAKKGSSDIRVYTVREGDTLSRVAEMFGVTTNTILWANDLPKATQIQPDDTLVILPVAGVQHEIKSGDTIGSIAKKYDGEAEEILRYNEMSSADQITVGDTIIIPGGTLSSVQARAASAKPVKIAGSVAGASSAGFVHPAPGSTRTVGIHGKNAVDLAAGVGTIIRSAAAGEVIVSKSSGWNGGYGQYIVVRHANGAQTLYAHLSKNYAGVGAWVAQGEAIGEMGSTGRSSGSHLHFEVRGARNPF